MRRSFRVSLSIAIATVALAGVRSARGDIVFDPGNHPQPGEQIVLLKNGTSGSTVQGTTNKTGTIVDFSSTTQTLTEPANGQARIEAQGANGGHVALRDVSSIALDSGATYQDIIFNSHIGGIIGTQGGTETITVTDNLGMTHQTTLTLDNGENFMTIFATNGESIASVAIRYPRGFTDLRQIRISLAASVPEPSSLVLAGTGLAVVLGVGYRRRWLRRPA
jgi:hypothetical protein